MSISLFLYVNICCFEPFGSAVRRSKNPSRYHQYQKLRSNSSPSLSPPLSPSINQQFLPDIMTFATIPFEILIEICDYLHPSDLYNLTMVCKRYRSLLWDKTSTTTQLIWKSSRKNFINNLNVDPPGKMCEQEFIWLMLLLNKCMFCNQTDKFELTMHWEFKMYCCFKCLNERTICKLTLLQKYNFPEELLACLPQLQKNPNPRDPPLYLIRDVENLFKQYNYEKDKKNWVKERQDQIIKLNIENEQYNTLHDQVRYDHTERLERLLRKLHDFYSNNRT
ncbi:hypothetical protein GLOIN_2v1879489 [Rhizophagus clarus]|uniref:F-box domain-containing protein n=1 Tax=Rhizophagus clarus TaxID=94130 RepID=A0A8H3M6K3_9GLOM|nr:hypothetical protein GLOIN_2v1879489 [Rhizophagus clarus]